MKQLFLFLFIIFTVLPLLPLAKSFAKETGASPAQYYLSGTVYGGDFSTPLFAASVALVNKKTEAVQKQKTNSAGGFAFIVPAGSYALNVIAGGYEPDTQSVSLSSGPISTYFILKKFSSSTPIQSTDSNANNTGSPESSASNQTGQSSTTTTSPGSSTTTSSSNAITNPDGSVTSWSNCVITRIGNPPGPLPSECAHSTTGGNNSGGAPADVNGILPWAEKITSSLKPGLAWGVNYYNNQETDICNSDTSGAVDVGNVGYCVNKRSGVDPENVYWCTFLVIDTFNLIGKKGLTPEEHLGVVYMMPFFKNTPGYLFLPYDPYNRTDQNKDTLRKVKPGMPWFLAYDPSQTIEQEHTGLVYSINIDQNGNGEIVTRESNSDQITHTFPIDGWNVITFDGFPLRGFGGIQ